MSWAPSPTIRISRTEPLHWLTTRTPDNIVVNLPAVADESLPNWLDRP